MKYPSSIQNLRAMNKQSVFSGAVHLLCLLSFACRILPVSAQGGNISQIVGQSELTVSELVHAHRILGEGYAGAYWFARVSFNAEDEFSITLPDGQSAAWRHERTKGYGPDAFSWRGRTIDGSGSATVTVNKGMVTARVSVNPTTVYRIEPLSRDMHIIYRLNQQKTVREESPENYRRMLNGDFELKEERATREPHEEQSEAGLLGNDCYIRILVGYESNIVLTDPVGFAIQCIELTNTIYGNSDINFEAELAFARIYNDVAPLDIDETLLLWESSLDGDFNEVHSDREQYDADFCILITEDFDGEYVGLASTILADYESAFCVVEDGAAQDNLSFTHEIGHLMGARHDEYVDGSGDYNHGYIIHSEKVRTVMAYNDECDDNGYNCSRIEYFSNPDKMYENVYALGDAETAHNERALDENEPEFKNFEPVVSDKIFLFSVSIDGEMYASVTAVNTVYNASDYEITGGATAVWSAGDYLVMEEGFLAQVGSTFEAKVAGCNAPRLADENTEAATGGSASSVSLFPNPASDQSTLALVLQQPSKLRVLLRDVTGRVIYEVYDSNTETTGTQNFQVEVSDYPSGIYFFEVVVNGEREISKLIVQR
jgi:hypothetical protein